MTTDNSHDLQAKRSSTPRQDLAWVLSLFGTAVGAGILFLPINAGMAGFWPLVLLTILVGPMTYFSHRNLARFVLSSNKPGANITDVVVEHFGQTAGNVITLLYFLAIYPILLIYGVGITNTTQSFITHQLGWHAPDRRLLSLMLIISMIYVILSGEKLMLRVTQALVYPLVLILFGLSLYLIPQWQFTALTVVPSAKQFISTVWITIPVLVFAFNHSPAISSFALSQQLSHGHNTTTNTDKILRHTSYLLLLFVMFFVFSCVMTLSPEQLIAAKQTNLPIVSYLANQLHNPLIAYCGPLIAFVAIASSFFGHYLGAREGLHGMLIKWQRSRGKEPNLQAINVFSAIFFTLTLWWVAVINPSILGMIETLGGPIIALFLFIMPVYAIAKVPAMQRYRGNLSNSFIAIMGIVAICSIVFQFCK